MAQYGYDPEPLFVRETKESYSDGKDLPKIVREITHKMESWENHVHYVFFCGKVYPVLPLTDPHTFKMSCVTVEDYIKEMVNRRDSKDYLNKPDKDFFRDTEVVGYFYKSYAHTQRGLRALAKELEEIKIPNDVFIQMDCPYFMVHYSRRGEYTVTKNPQLSNCNFFKFMDAFTCFQEIAMFLGSVLVKDTPMSITTGDDKVLAQQKGFDDMSFKTMAPGKKKLNRKENKLKKRNAT